VHRSATPGERILAAADKLFYTQGIRGVGVDAIAEEAKVSKRTLYNYYPTKDDLVAAYLTARFKLVPPSDAPAREQILGYFDRLERLFAEGGFRGCPYVNAVTELGDRKHAATHIAMQFKAQRLAWYRTLLERMRVAEPERLAMQLQLLVEGAISAVMVSNDASVARDARAAAEVLLDAAPKIGVRARIPRQLRR
jgi:AcrR family transcriptional regulator